MKIIAISDLHGNLPEISKCDILCICGDIFPIENQIISVGWFYNMFIPWVESLPCKKVLMIGGNHDFVLYNKNKNHKESYERLSFYYNSDKLIYLLDESYEFEGKIFYGTPWIPDLDGWAFYGDSKTLVNKFKNIPDKVDVLMTHCPPKLGSAGIVHQWADRNYTMNYGCQELDNILINNDIKWWVCGHIHTGNHTPENIYNTNLVNVSILDEDYIVNYPPFEFTI